ncbi:MAG: class I SAM-dependent methyltransferase [Jatrophihabitans sp.]
MNRDDILRSAKAGYIRMVMGAGGLLDRVGVLPGPAPQRDRRVRHWAYSLRLIHDSAGLAALDVPWWTYRASAFVERWIRSRTEPVRVFEYGSGASTVWLARRAAEVHSVEHDATFAREFAPMLAGQRSARLQIVPAVPSRSPSISSAKEGWRGLDFSDYVAAIDGVDGDFDLVVIDGRAREACLRKALPRLHREGIIVFDDSWRRRYRAAIDAADVDQRRFGGLTPTMPYPTQTSVLTPGRRRR